MNKYCEWLPRKAIDEERCKNLASRWNISPLITKVLLARGVEEEKIGEFLFPSFENTPDPFLMRDMDKAVERILLAFSRKEKVLIFGDFDVDGITSTSLLLRFFKDLNFPSFYYIPHRLNEGYSLNKEAIQKAYKKGIKLIITCDCGSSSIEEIKFAHSLGMEVIVTDHHEVEFSKQKELIILNPHRPECPYPFKDLAGVGVVFKLCQAISEKINFPRERLLSYLDLVAIGTVADLVPLSGENRCFVKLGLENIPSNTTSVGLRALINVTGLSERSIGEREVGYILAPRLNACGRLSLAKTAVKLLLSESGVEAKMLAEKLNRENSRRQSLEKKMCEEAEAILAGEMGNVLVVASKNWHPGVIGLVASYLKEKYNRPAVAFSIEEKNARGSARSIPGFSIFDALKACSGFITAFGGHKMAAGLTCPAENIQKIGEKLNLLAQKMLSPEDFIPRRYFDSKVEFEQLSCELVEELNILSPFGSGNPKPLFLARGVEVCDFQEMARGKRVFLKDREGRGFEGVIFDNGAKEKIEKRGRFDILYFPRIDNWRGEKKVQLEVKDIKETSRGGEK